jgi:PD-(D/E)XK nuclease superfamily
MIDTFTKWQSEGHTIVGEDKLAASLKDGKEMLKGIQWEHMKPDVLEHRFLLPFPNADNSICMVEGFIDMITQEGSIIDHKSNSKLPNKAELAHDPQFILYRWAYTQLYDTVPYAVYWHQLKTGEFIDSGVDKGYDEKLRQLGHDIFDIITMTTYQRRLLDSECRQCPFFKDCYGDENIVAGDIETE